MCARSSDVCVCIVVAVRGRGVLAALTSVRFVVAVRGRGVLAALPLLPVVTQRAAALHARPRAAAGVELPECLQPRREAGQCRPVRRLVCRAVNWPRVYGGYG